MKQKGSYERYVIALRETLRRGGGDESFYEFVPIIQANRFLSFVSIGGAVPLWRIGRPLAKTVVPIYRVQPIREKHWHEVLLRSFGLEQADAEKQYPDRAVWELWPYELAHLALQKKFSVLPTCARTGKSALAVRPASILTFSLQPGASP